VRIGERASSPRFRGDGDRMSGANGNGEPSLPENPSRGDLALVEQAARHRWPMRPEYRESLIRRLWSIALDPKSSERVVARAARTIALFDKINLGAEAAGVGQDGPAGLQVSAGKAGAPASVQDILAGIRKDPELVEIARQLAYGQARLPHHTEGNNGNGNGNSRDQ